MIKELTSVPARIGGLADRGRLAVGYKADLNIIDADAMRLHQPTVKSDLPAGGPPPGPDAPTATC